VTIVPPAEALTRWLPKAKAEADDVVLLYYGPAGGAKKIADAFGKDLAAILVGGARPEELPQGTAVPLAATAEHGKSLARLTLGAKEPAGQIAIDNSVAPDPKMASFLAEETRPPAPQAQAPGADAKAAADVGDATDGGVRKLVQVEVPPIEPAAAEPAPAPSTAAARAEPTPAEPARSEPPTPKDATADAAAEPADTSKPTAAPHAGHASGAWDFLKSLVGGGAKPSKATSAEKAPPAESEKPGPTDESASKRPVADEPAPATEASAPANPPAVQPQRAPAAAATGPKFCTNCGAKLSPNAKFCTHCGTRVRR
jgi:hypothetical protein